MNFIRKFMGSSKSDEIASIPSGKLFLRRSPRSPKGELECLYNDAFACVRQTSRQFLYQLCVMRVYQEGELDTIGSSGFSDSEDEDSEDGAHSLSDGHMSGGRYRDEWVFAIVSDLRIRKYDKGDGSVAIGWRDLNGDPGDRFEFVVDEDVKSKAVESFMVTIYKCMYEQKYNKSPITVDNIDPTSIFDSDSEDEYNLSGDYKSKLFGTVPVHPDDSTDEEFHDATDSSNLSNIDGQDSKHVVANALYSTSAFDLFLFDSETENFQLQISSPSTKCTINGCGNWMYKLNLKVDNDRVALSETIGKFMSPTFNYDHLSFIFNSYIVRDENFIAHSWLMKFRTYEELHEFQSVFMKALWETTNKQEWVNVNDTNKEYFANAFSKLSLSDSSDVAKEDIDMIVDDDEEESPDDEDETEEDDDPRERTNKTSLRFLNNRHGLYDESDDEDDEEKEIRQFKSKAKNSNLTVGYSKDRSYVVRGDKLGVFGNEEDGIEFKTTIAGLKDLSGKTFNPKKLMLHQQDEHMLMTDESIDNTKLYRLDLNRGDIVEEWDMAKDTLTDFGPNSKFAQLTSDPTLLGVTSKSIFRIDPRLQGSKMVKEKSKTYKTNKQFSVLATTQNGYKAVGSANGDISLYSELGTRASSLLPSLGEPVTGLDVSKDGRWLLATCQSYLLLINTKITEGQRNAGELGFTHYFDKDKKPIPRRLALSPEHLTYMLQETNKESFKFTKARFNAGIDTNESSIVTSFGPYIITWSLKKVLEGRSNPYLVKRYEQDVIAENFKFGSNSDVILALQDDVSMLNRSKLRRPNRRIFSGDS